jgi:hypothetical protein
MTTADSMGRPPRQPVGAEKMSKCSWCSQELNAFSGSRLRKRSAKMERKRMKQVVPHGYAIPQEHIKRLTDELRTARAVELAAASEQERTRIEEEIKKEVQKKLKGRRAFWPGGCWTC